MNENIKKILTTLSEDNGHYFLYEDKDDGCSHCGICGKEAINTFHEGLVAQHYENCLVLLAKKELEKEKESQVESE